MDQSVREAPFPHPGAGRTLTSAGPTDVMPVRCFVGAFLEAESARRLQSAAFAALGELLRRRDVRQVPLENYHVTLKFLGETPEDALAEALARVASLEAFSSTGQTTGLVGFPRSAAARLVAAELTPEERLSGWWTALQSSFGAEDRDFRPHVTVVRCRRTRRFAALPLGEPVPLALGPPRLYRSDQTAHGARYTPVTDPGGGSG